MITRGSYELSLDGGKTWSLQHNLLLDAYFNTVPAGAITCLIGSSNTPPIGSDTSITTPLISTSVVREALQKEVLAESTLIRDSYVFAFGTGNTLSAKELGVRCATTLVSRALIKSVSGAPITIEIDPLDDVQVRYTLEYEFSLQPVPIQITLNGVIYNGTLTVANPFAWTSPSLGVIVSGTRVATCPLGNFSVVNGAFVGSSIAATEAGTGVLSQVISSQSRGVSTVYTSDLTTHEAPFGQLVLMTNSSFTASSVLAVISLGATVTKTVDEVLNISFLFSQEPEL